MNIIISSVGKINRQEPEQKIIDEYHKRITWKLQIIELSDKKIAASDTRKQQESQLILKSIPKGYFVIILDETGKNLTSEEFAKYISNLQTSGHSNIAFAIGGAYGHSSELLAKSDYVIALGKMTISHKLARVVLIEQLYRAQTIISGHPYHK
jgi:23S rRNA (pseudouridine1915-N3)-methyltransferase